MGERFENIISESDVPEAARSMMLRIVRRTRLRKREKVTVARELVERFASGLREGTPEPELIAHFGDEKQQARKIRRSMKRRRRIIWHAWVWWWRAAFTVCGLILAVFCYYGFQVWFTVPNICTDYRAELFETSEAPESERAWPLVKEATSHLAPIPKIGDENGRSVELNIGVVPEDSEHWDVVVDYVRASARSLEIARLAGTKPVFGFVPLRDEVSPEGSDEAREKIPPLATVDTRASMPILVLVRLLCADARLAASEGNGARSLEDIRAAIGLCRGVSSAHSTMALALNYASFRMAGETVGEIIHRRPALWTDEQLVRLAAELTTLTRDRLRPDQSRMRAEFADYLQRVFTDDGNGGGFYVGGHRGSEIEQVLKPIKAEWFIGRPLGAILVHDRREQDRKFEEVLPWLAGLSVAPLWGCPSLNMVQHQLRERLGGVYLSGRYWPIFDCALHAHLVHGPLDCALMTRDATVTAIAIERFRRKYARFPESLDELMPEWLPAHPTDVYTGSALCYSLVAHNPLIYSVGVNYEDDGGTSSTPPSSPFALRIDGWRSRDEIEGKRRYDPNGIPDGDWILYPPSVAE